MDQLHDQEKALARVLRALNAIKKNEMVIMVDDEDRENEGDFVFAAEHTTPEKVNFLCREGRGLICLALETPIIDQLKLPMMHDAGKSTAARHTAFTVSIEAKSGVTTGISAHDRAHTIKVAVADDAKPDDLVVPGHVFPLKARSGGVLERAGHTEGSVDLVKFAGCKGAAVICEIMNEDGSMARRPDLEILAAKYDLPIVSIADLIQYRLMQESFVAVESRHKVKTSHGVFEAVQFRSRIDGMRHVALVKGEGDFAEAVVDVRVHIQRPIVDVFGARDGGRFRVEQGLDALKDSSHAVFVYLLKAGAEMDIERELVELQGDTGSERAASSTSASAQLDVRHIGIGSQILRALGVRRMRVLSTTTHPYKGLSGFGLEVVEQKILSKRPDAAEADL